MAASQEPVVAASKAPFAKGAGRSKAAGAAPVAAAALAAGTPASPAQLVAPPPSESGEACGAPPSGITHCGCKESSVAQRGSQPSAKFSSRCVCFQDPDHRVSDPRTVGGGKGKR